MENILNSCFSKMKEIYISEKFQTLKRIIFSLCFVIGFDYYFFKGSFFGMQSILNFVILFLTYFFLSKNKGVSFKNKKIAYIFSTIFSVHMIVGKIIYDYNDIAPLYNGISSMFANLITLIGFLVIVGEILYVIFNKLIEIEKKSSKVWSIFNIKYIYFLLWIIIFASWIPAFLAYYPGISCYDIGVQVQQCVNENYTKYHPPIHTFLVKLLYISANKINVDPLVFYSIIQMLFLAAVLAKMIKLLIDKKTNNIVILSGLLFVMINPVIAVFSMVTTKDIYFAGFLILFIIEIVKLIENPSTYLKSPFNWIKYILFGVLACLFRNNAIYAIILSVPFFVISLRKYWKKVLIIIIVFLCVYYGISDFVYAKLGVKDGKPQEMLSVPIQQISSVSAYHDSEISNDEKNEIDKFLSYNDVKRIYNPRFTDVCKDTFKSKYYKQHKNEFFELWIKLFKKYPSDYVTAFLTLNIPYWYINANSVDAYSKRKYIEDNMIKTDYYTKERESKLPKLYEFYGKVTSFELFENTPLVSNIFSLSTPIWLLLFTMFTLIYKKQIKLINVILPIIFLWLTYIAGPVSNFRYIFPIVCLYPLLIALIINSSKFNQ